MLEVIGFIISLLALLYIFIKQNASSQRPSYPPRYSEEESTEESPFKEFMEAFEQETLGREAAQRLPPPPPKEIKQSQTTHPVALENYRRVSAVEKRQLKSSLENSPLTSKFNRHEENSGHFHRLEQDEIRRPSRARLSIQRLAHRRDILIYQEMIDKPKSMRIGEK